MLFDLLMVAAILAYGNVQFHHFDPKLSIARRLLKTALALAVTAVVSHYFGTRGVLIELSVFAIPLVYVHGFWLPRNGVNGWTGEPREKYYQLRGWPPEGP